MHLSLILPELYDLGVHVAPEWEMIAYPRIFQHLPEWTAPATALAYSVVGNHHGIRDHLVARDEWDGTIPSCIVFVAEPDDYQQAVAWLLHELAHQLPPTKARRELVEPLASERAAQLQFLSSAGTNPSMPWVDHDAAFIRRLLHLRYRAEVAGVPTYFGDLMTGSNYALRPLIDYWRVLGDEPEEMFLSPFARIEQTLAPAKFTELFNEDTRNYLQNKD